MCVGGEEHYVSRALVTDHLPLLITLQSSIEEGIVQIDNQRVWSAALGGSMSCAATGIPANARNWVLGVLWGHSDSEIEVKVSSQPLSSACLSLRLCFFL
jgi:hypothetical protein